MPRPTHVPDLRSAARMHTDMALNVLAGVARSAKCPPGARVQAAQTLLDRGWGKAEQAHVGPDGGDIKVTIRQIIETVGQSGADQDGGDQGQGDG